VLAVAVMLAAGVISAQAWAAACSAAIPLYGAGIRTVWNACGADAPAAFQA
jgi:hypothetical protein